MFRPRVNVTEGGFFLLPLLLGFMEFGYALCCFFFETRRCFPDPNGFWGFLGEFIDV